MILAYLLLLTGLTISAVAIYYSVVGLTAIFSAAVIPIIVMGASLEVAKLVCASWLKANWERAPRLMKWYMSIAVVVLMLITSMGIFGFLSKAHNDQNLVSGDVQSKIAVYDEKIKTAKENIESDRKQLKQMDDAVDQVMARSTSEEGATKSNGIRKAQQRDRSALAKDIETNQKLISSLNDEAAPIRAEVRKVEAEVGPIKYIAKFIYGDAGASEGMLEKAVTWIIILIVVVFDPLAVIMLLASQMTFAWHNKGQDPLAEEEVELLHNTVEHTETPTIAELDRFVGEPPTAEEKAEIEEATVTFKEPVIPYTIVDEFTEPDYPEPTVKEPTQHEETELDKWNKMIAEAEAEVARANENESTVEERVARGDSYIDGEGHEVSMDDAERPGDYLSDPEKKTYMMRDENGEIQTKSRE
jgi:hypothetical protein